MTYAGVDTSVFTPQSTHSASAAYTGRPRKCPQSKLAGKENGLTLPPLIGSFITVMSSKQHNDGRSSMLSS